jgi:hypothetical protein
MRNGNVCRRRSGYRKSGTLLFFLILGEASETAYAGQMLMTLSGASLRDLLETFGSSDLSALEQFSF